MNTMESLGKDDLEAHRKSLLAHARARHKALGISPREDLVPERIVIETIDRAVTLTRSTKDDLDREAWLIRLLDQRIESRWGEAVEGYVASLSRYALIHWNEWGLSDRLLEVGDLVAEAWANSQEQRSKFRGKTDQEFSAWLRSILEHHAVDQIRYQRAQRRNPDRERYEGLTESGRQLADILFKPDQSTASGKAHGKEALARIFEALEALTSPEREVVVMEYRGLTRVQIAKEMSRARKDIDRILYQGWGKLRSKLRNLDEAR